MSGAQKESTHFSVEADLRHRVEAARVSLRHAMEEVHRLRMELPDGAKQMLHLKKAAQAHRNAIDVYRAALKELDGFIRWGETSKDL